jgi:hypothetical protein
MTRADIVTLALLGLVASGRAASAEESTATTINFENDEVGRTPNAFTIALTGGGEPGEWVVQEDPNAPGGTKVLVQTSADTTGSRFPLCVYNPLSAADVTLSVKFKAISGTVDRAGGLVWRYQDPQNYYLVRANALEGNVVLYKVEKGKRSDLKPLDSALFSYGKKAHVEPGRWHTLQVQARGKHFTVSLNGEHLFDVEDETLSRPGKVGLWTKADSVSAFDDLTISTDSAEAAPR